MTRVRIAFVCEGFNRSSVVGQPWNYVSDIARRMIARGNPSYVLTDGSPRIPKDEDIGGISVRRISRGRLVFHLQEVCQNLNDADVDVIAWYGGLLSAQYFWQLRNSLRKNIAWNIYSGKLAFGDLRNLRCGDFFSIDNFWNNLLYSIIPPFTIRRGASVPQVRSIITQSRRLKDQLSAIGVEAGRILVIPPGVDTKVFRPRTSGREERRRMLGLDRSDPIVLYLGPPTSLRGADTAVCAISKVIREIPSAKLVFLSRRPGGKRPNSIERMAGMQKATRILTGIQTEESLVRLVSFADLVILPFRFWPQIECPSTILEAMAMEKPVITTNVGSIPEVVNHGTTGIIIPPGNASALASAIVAALRNEDLFSSMARRARRYVEKFHDLDVVVQQTFDILESTITSRMQG